MYLVFVETASFTKYLSNYMDDEEYANFQAYLAANPEVGDVIPHSNSLRKVRWAGKGKGKRGRIRVIYYNRLNNGKLWLLSVYAKGECEDLTTDELKMIRKEVPND